MHAPAPEASTATPKLIDFEAFRRSRESSARTAEPFESIATLRRPEPGSSTATTERRTTTTQRQSLEAELELRRALNLVQDDVFEDGVENEVSRAVPRLVACFGSAAVEATARLYLDRLLAPDIMSEVLRWLGHVEDEASSEACFWFLIYCLRDSDPRVRSAAALGLASLEDARAVPYLQREAQVERIGLLRSRLEKVADELGG